MEVDDNKFERVEDFENLGVINNNNIASENICYFSIIKLLRSKVLSRKPKVL